MIDALRPPAQPCPLSLFLFRASTVIDGSRRKILSPVRHYQRRCKTIISGGVHCSAHLRLILGAHDIDSFGPLHILRQPQSARSSSRAIKINSHTMMRMMFSTRFLLRYLPAYFIAERREVAAPRPCPPDYYATTPQHTLAAFVMAAARRLPMPMVSHRRRRRSAIAPTRDA